MCKLDFFREALKNHVFTLKPVPFQCEILPLTRHWHWYKHWQCHWHFWPPCMKESTGDQSHSFGKIAPFVHLQKFFSKTASRAVINVKFEQKSASRAEVKHKNGLKTILFRKILRRTHFKHVFRNYAMRANIRNVMSMIFCIASSADVFRAAG